VTCWCRFIAYPLFVSKSRTVSLVTLGCARNEVDSEELAARLAVGGWTLLDEGEDADVVLVNTCGFIEAAKQESIDAVVDASASGAKVAAVGCLAERYGADLAAAFDEPDDEGEEPVDVQVLGFDDYSDIAARLDDVLAGNKRPAHVARDRRKLLPVSPAERQEARSAAFDPRELPDGVAPASGPVTRKRLTGGVVAPLKIASGCDRRCSFCAIPSFRGSFVSRRPTDIYNEAAWLAEDGVRELVLVSENSTSYGKDLGDLRLLERVLPDLAQIEDIARIRVSYLQPAEVRPGLVEVIAGTLGVAPYFDLSFQHASGPVLRRMRRFGDRERFLQLIEQIRAIAPDAGVRSNFIVGFPGETEDDLKELELFLTEARLDAIGVFGYSDEDGTEAAGFADGDKLDEDEVKRRERELHDLADELMAQRAEERVGSTVEVLIEEVTGDGQYEGRAAHQGPDDGSTTVLADQPLVPGDLVTARVTESLGPDLIARALPSLLARS
jgi:ribosomal protein S12 methylthiotransferase